MLFRLQKKALRLVTKSSRFCHTESLFKFNSILKLEDLSKLEAAKFFYQNQNVKQNFNIGRGLDLHSHNTQSASNLLLPRVRTELARKFVLCSGFKLYNDLPHHVLLANSKANFKCLLKKNLLEAYTSL